MSVFPLSVSLNQLTSITFLPGKLRKKRKTAKHLYRKQTNKKPNNNELSQHQLGARGGNRESGRC